MSSGLSVVTSALQSSNTEARILGENLARSNVPGASQQRVNYVTVAHGGAGSGVRIQGIERIVDMNIVNNIQLEEAVSGSTRTRSYYLQGLQEIFGKPGNRNSLSNQVALFQESLINLSNLPNSDSKRLGVITQGKNVADYLNKAGNRIQETRRSVDHELDLGLKRVNEILRHLQRLNGSISYEYALNNPLGPLEDEREQFLRELSGLIDIQVTEASNKSISIRATAGGQLLSHEASTITYAPSANVVAGTVFQPILLAGQDMTASLLANGKGQLAGLLEIRDTVTVKFQEEMDTFTQTLRDGVNRVHNEGTAFPAAHKLTGVRGLNGADALTGTGTVRLACLDAGGLIQGIRDIDLSTLTDVNSLITAINGGGGMGVTAALDANGHVVLEAVNAAHGISLVSLNGATVSAGTGLSHYLGLNDFFVTSNNLYGQANVGITSTLRVRADIVAAPAGLSVGKLVDTTPTPALGQRGLTAGDAGCVREIHDLLNQSIGFSAAGRLSAQTVTLGAYATNILADIAALSAATKESAKGDQNYLESLKSLYEKDSKPSLEESIMQMEELAMRRAALLRCVETERDFLERIERI